MGFRSLLSLVPPSCIVAPIRELVNKYLSTSAFNSTPLQMTRIPANEAMDVNNYNDIRGRTTSSSKVSLRVALVTSNASSISYHERMEINNNLSDEEFRDPIDSSQLSYKGNNEEGNPVSEVTDNSLTRNLQHVRNKALALKNIPKPQGKGTSINNTNMSQSDNIINI